MSEVIPKGLPGPVVAMSTGVATNHSSTVMSVANAGQANAEGAQWDDDEDGTGAVAGEYARLAPKDYDPNLSGPHPTASPHDWGAGYMSPGLQNNDYMGVLGSGGHEPAFGPDNSQPQAQWSGGQASQGGIPISAIVRR